MIMLLGVLFISGIQPVLMITVLMMITFLYSIEIWSYMGGYWFSYIMIMVMLSGVLVVFTYMVSLIPNESFETYNLLIVMMFMLIMVNKLYVMLGDDESYITMKLWESFLSMFNLYLVVYLLSMMIIVVWISNLGEGAIRVI